MLAEVAHTIEKQDRFLVGRHTAYKAIQPKNGLPVFMEGGK
jgi:hypothetical protein